MVRSFGLVNGCAASMLALLSATPVWAQIQPPPAAEDVTEAQISDESAVEQAVIVVAGSRLRSSGFEAPTSVSVITEEEIDRVAPATIADFVNQLPALSGSNSPRTTRGNLADALGGGNFLNLRNLGALRTLVLLNGHKVTPSTVTGVTDVNALPSSLFSRVDVVTGGASAAWVQTLSPASGIDTYLADGVA